jgi:hypothetical protein
MSDRALAAFRKFPARVIILPVFMLACLCRWEAIMKRYCCRLKLFLAVLILLLLICGCSQDGDESSLFQDDFSNPRGGWGAEQREEFRRGYTGESYFFEIYAPNWFAWAYPGKQYGDVSVEVDTSLASGSADGHFGVFCRHMDVDNFYYFAISADGYYAIFRRVDGGKLEILTGDGSGMLPSSAIRTGSQTNRVVAVCKEDALSLYVNGELLESVTDVIHTQGDVGLGVGSGPKGEVSVKFDNFAVTEP